MIIRKSDGLRVDHEKKSDGVRVHHEKERWGESLPSVKRMALDFTMRKKAMGMRVNHEKKSVGMRFHLGTKERWGES